MLRSKGRRRRPVSWRAALLLLAVVVGSSPASAGTTVGGIVQNAVTANGNGGVTTVFGTFLVATYSVSGTFTATVNFEGSGQDGTFQAIGCIPLTAGVAVSSTTTTGIWRCNIVGVIQIRARVSGYVSGSVTVSVTASDFGTVLVGPPVDSGSPSTTSVIRLQGFTTSALPAAGTSGRIARVTDGATGAFVMDDGTNWNCDAEKAERIFNVTCPRWGAVPTSSDTGTDSTTAIQRALTAMQSGDVVFIPPTNNSQFFRITACLKLPVVNGVIVLGAGKRASRIRQTGTGVDGICSNNVFATSTAGIEIRNLWIDSSGNGRYGLNWEATQRSAIRNVRISGFNGTGGAGIFTKDSLLVTVDTCDLDGNRNGVLEDGTALNTGPNGWRIINCNIENQTNLGVNLYQSTGLLFAGNTLEANAGGGFTQTTAGNALEIVGNYFESNLTAGGAGTYADINIGSAAFIQGVAIEGNNFTGRSVGETADYYPIRVNNSAGMRVASNFINVGNRFLSFTSGSGVSDSVFGSEGYSSAFTLTDPTTVYGGVPGASFLQSRNTLTDIQVIPIDGQNFYIGDLPYGGWTSSGPALTRAAGNENGRPVGTIAVVAATDIRQSFTLSSTSFARALSRWVSWCMDVAVTSGTGGVALLLDNGTTGTTNTQTATTTWTTYCVSNRFASTDTSLRTILQLNSAVTYLVSNPRLVVGLDVGKQPGAFTGTPYWTASAVPAAGTWARGDIVWNSAPASGGTAGWINVTAGAPGTWMAFAGLGTDAVNPWAAPPAIGTTTAAAGAFTTLTASTPLGAASGGTGLASYAIGDLLYASATTTLARLADVAAGSYLRSGGVGVAPLWSTLTLPNTATLNRVVFATGTNAWGDSANLTYTGSVLTVTLTGAGVQTPVVEQNLQAAGTDVGSELLFTGDTGALSQTVLRSAWTAASNLDSYMSMRVRSGGAIVDGWRVVSTGGVVSVSTAGALTATTSATIGGATPTAITNVRVYSSALTPAQMAGSIAFAEQTFTVTGLTTADKVVVNPGGVQGTQCAFVGTARVSAADTLALTFFNSAASLCTPASSTYLIVAIRS